MTDPETEPAGDDAETPGPAGDQPGPTEDGPAPPRRRRRLLLAVAVLAVVVIAGGLVGWWLARRGGSSTTTGPKAAAAFTAAYRRSLEGTYHVEGEFTRTLADGRSLQSAFLVAQRPPDRIQRLLGSTTGVLGGKEINCGAPAAGGAYQCAPGASAPSWDQRVAGQMATLASYVDGSDPLYQVTDEGGGCFTLTRTRQAADATFGIRSRFCFDASTGAVRRLELHRDDGSSDVLVAVVVSGQVTPSDFDVSADATYDPKVPDGSTGSTAPAAQEGSSVPR